MKEKGYRPPKSTIREKIRSILNVTENRLSKRNIRIELERGRGVILPERKRKGLAGGESDIDEPRK